MAAIMNPETTRIHPALHRFFRASRFAQALFCGIGCALLAASPTLARDSLGIFSAWGAFRDPSVPRCYAIAMAEASTMQRDYQPYASIGTWPKRAVRNQLHLRVSRRLAANSAITLTIGNQRFALSGGGGDYRRDALCHQHDRKRTRRRRPQLLQQLATGWCSNSHGCSRNWLCKPAVGVGKLLNFHAHSVCSSYPAPGMSVLRRS
jgi:hypothetical protein